MSTVHDFPPFASPNSDESLAVPGIPFIGNFHKTLPHNEFGEVEPTAYRAFMQTCLEIEAGVPKNFEAVTKGPTDTISAPFQTAFAPGADTSVAKFTSPLAAAATEEHGPDPQELDMPPAPGIRSVSTTAEMAEVYAMALLRDVPLVAFQAQATRPDDGCVAVSAADTKGVKEATARLNTLFDYAVTCDTDPGKLMPPMDLAAGPGGADLTVQTVFRSGLHDEQYGPLISQFFIRPVGYGTQTIDQKQFPYIAAKNFLTTHGDWLLAQNTGKDKFGRGYSNCNNYADQVAGLETYYANDRRYIATMRDLARFVNRDALHQAYFNAALFLLGINAPLDKGNPYRGAQFSREGEFASLGAPDLLTLVSEVANRCLKVVWRQKWLVHRRCRPEVFGGLLQMQRNGLVEKGKKAPTKRHYGIADFNHGVAMACMDSKLMKAAEKAFDAIVADASALNGGTLFLPMAFSAGSPTHPAYGAGHATVAGACVTVLKAWFDEDVSLKAVFDANAKGIRNDPPESPLTLLQPAYRKKGGGLDDFCEPQPYSGDDAAKMTVGGELNKIASNVAMGRTMGGVHWRSDNTRSLRLGELIAIEILRKRTEEYAERPVSFTFRAFDRHTVRISNGEVHMLG